MIPSNSKLCPWGRGYDSNHAVCRSCPVQCVFKDRLPNLTSGGTFPETKGKIRGRQPNKTETACMNWLAYEYPGQRIRFEAVTFHLENRASYTPDIEVTLPGGNLLYVECKNAAYKHASYGRSKIAFADARLAYPFFQWQWLELDKGIWIKKDY